MALQTEDIKRCFGAKNYSRGLAYYRQGKVSKLQESLAGNSVRLDCTVSGSRRYSVVLFLNMDTGSIRGSCTCPHFAQTEGMCKHLAAALISYAKADDDVGSSDDNAKRLLDAYLAQGREELPSSPARLSPKILTDERYIEDGYPSFSFRVGVDRLYAIQNIKDFLNRVAKRETYTYGKNLTLFHGLEQFDELSQKMINILMDEFDEYRSFSHSGGWYGSYSSPGYQRGTITLTGNAFDRWFDLLRGQELETVNKGETIRLEDGDPEVLIRLKKKKNSALLTVENPQEVSMFGNDRTLYTLRQDRLMRCSPEFQKHVFPMLASLSVRQIRLSLSDLSVFCGCVLPRIQDYVVVDDPQNLLQKFSPDECVPCFYFDMVDDCLTAKLTFRYDTQEVQLNLPTDRTPDIKRDVPEEQAALRLLLRYFQEEDGIFSLSGSDDAVYNFLTDTLDTFRQYGEVFVTDALRKKRILPTKASVGISVSNGLLRLDMDTGDFPPEELESLYQSLLRQRKYHKLPDGRYLTLDGSPYEKLAEAAHMLQLSGKELKKGEVSLPAYRGLYLDSVLSDNEGIQVSRDKNMRAMIRNFKSVAESDYTLPDGLDGILRPYQKIGFQWLKTLEGCGFGGILADEMGLGKTLQVISFLASIDQNAAGIPSLIVCPTSLILNWAEEFERFAPQLKITLVMGPAAQRKELLAAREGSNVLVTSYELLRQDIEQYADIPFYCCVLDEGQHIKNQTTQISKAVKQIVCQQRFVLTGTPIENRLSELWNLFDFLMPGYLYTHNGFVSKLEKPIVKSGNAEAAGQLRRLVQPFMLRRLKQDVLKDLPPKMEHVRRIPLSEEEQKVYAACVVQARNSLAAAGAAQQGKMRILAALTQLRQVCCDPALSFENYIGPASKLEACLELCSGMVENGHQILLFSQFTSMLNRIRPRLDQLHISNYTIQGSTSKEQRARLVKDFNAGGASVFLISLKAGGTGLNLTAADVVIHYDPWWNLAAQDQATDRAHRIGQQSRVQVYKLIAKDTVEERILDLQERKAALMDTVSGGVENGILSMSEEDLLSLLDEK